MFNFRQPQFVVRDPDVIKKIGVKDFDHFTDHVSFADGGLDTLWSNTLFLMKGDKWRHMRATLSPAFTGSKMRLMFELVSDCANDVVNHFLDKAANGDSTHIEMKDFFSRYTNDVIASCAFGLKINSFSEPTNTFYTNGKKAMNFSGFIIMLKIIVMGKMPGLAKALNISFVDSDVAAHFKSTVLETMALRKIKNIVRPDMINILMQVRDGSLKTQAEEKTKDGFATVEESDVGKMAVQRIWTDDELVAQCFLFFVAGFETSSTVLSFGAYELVANPDVQQKLYEEILDTNESLNGKRISYDALQKMTYLDQFICEALRKWPPAVQVDRECGKDYVYDDGKRPPFKIEKGGSFVFPIYGIHHNPDYFPDPEKFDPERFSEENKDSIIPGTYIPFGVGPRNCIGKHFHVPFTANQKIIFGIFRISHEIMFLILLLQARGLRWWS